MTQLEKAWAVNHFVGRSSPSCNKQAKRLQKALNLKLRVFSDLGGRVYHNIVMVTLQSRLCPLHIGQVLRLSGAVNQKVLQNASLQITLTVPEVVGRY